MTTTYTNVTESSDLEFKMTRAKFIKYYSKEEYWLPMPLYTVGLIHVMILEHCACFIYDVDLGDYTCCCRKRKRAKTPTADGLGDGESELDGATGVPKSAQKLRRPRRGSAGGSSVNHVS